MRKNRNFSLIVCAFVFFIFSNCISDTNQKGSGKVGNKIKTAAKKSQVSGDNHEKSTNEDQSFYENDKIVWNGKNKKYSVMKKLI